MPAEATPAVLHITGYVTGATLYAMLLVLLVRAGSHDRLARATALLGIGWNAGELLFHGILFTGWRALGPWFAATAYTALGLLASVVVHSVSRPRDDSTSGQRRLATVAAAMAYATGTLAGVLHLRAAAVGTPLPAIDALDVMTVGLVATGVPLVMATRRQHHWRRALWMTSLAIFGVSALHLGRFHGTNESWLAELVGHHASIPLAFAMLYRDYRFALADLFLKRGLTLLVLVAIVVATYTALGPGVFPTEPVALGLLLVAWIGTALLFPSLRRFVSGFVDRVVLARPDYAAVTDDLAGRVQHAGSIEQVLRTGCESLAVALAAPVRATEIGAADSEPGPHVVVVAVSEAPHYQLVVGPLSSGRRLLSDDQTLLDRAALLLARRIDALRITAERYEAVIREREMTALTTEAELRALRAQVNPHFLFNALTTIGYLIQHAPLRARDTLMQLTTLLRAVLKSDGELTSLGRERDLVEAYLRIEHARFEDRLTTMIDVPPHLTAVRIPPLIIQPLVENAIKHGVAPSRTGGHVSIVARLQARGDTALLRVAVTNTGAPLAATRPVSGVGVASVSRRLAHHYRGAAAFSLGRAEDGATLAEIQVPIDTGAASHAVRTGTDR